MNPRGRVEEALRQSEEQFRLLVEGVRDYAIFMLDAEGRVISWNTGAELIKGYRADEIIGQHFSTFYPRDAVERGWPEEELRRAAAEGRFEDEGWRLRKDGTRFWANVVITALRDRTGRLVGFGKVTRDLTERRRAEERLRRREQQLAEAQAIAHLGNWDWNVRTGAVSWSDELYRIVGLEPVTGDMRLAAFFERVHPDDRTALREELEHALRAGGLFGLETRVVRPDGVERLLQIRGEVSLDEEGEAVRLFGTAQDITEQRAAEQAARRLELEQAARAEAEAAAHRLRESEARFRTLADTAPVMIWMTGADGRCEWVNRPWLEFTGRALDRELGHGWLENRHPVDHERTMASMREAVERREAYRLEYRMRRSDGSYRWVLDHGVPRVTATGELAGYIGSCVDIHDRIMQQRALEENTLHLEQLTSELEHAVEELQFRTAEEATARAEAESARADAEEASRAKSQFLAVMSHELRTPLNAIMGFTDLLAAGIGGPLTEAQQQNLSRIQSSALHLLELINRVLSLSRIEAGGEDVVITRIDAGAIVRDSAALIEPAAAKKELRLVVNVPDEPLPLDTDAGKVRQILLNLLNNAVKFTDEGEIEISLEARPDGVRIRVRDSGIGISPEYVDHIFTPFVQVEPSPARGRGGTGLGLSVTRELARLLGGDVLVESKPRGGSTFTVMLPRSSRARRTGQDRPGRQSADAG